MDFALAESVGCMYLLVLAVAKRKQYLGGVGVAEYRLSVDGAGYQWMRPQTTAGNVRRLQGID